MHILKDFSRNATLTKMLINCLNQIFSLFEKQIDQVRHLVCINKKIKTQALMIAELRLPKQVAKSHRVSRLYIISAKKFLNRCPFSKAIGKAKKKNMKVYASGNVHYVYVSLYFLT